MFNFHYLKHEYILQIYVKKLYALSLTPSKFGATLCLQLNKVITGYLGCYFIMNHANAYVIF